MDLEVGLVGLGLMGLPMASNLRALAAHDARLKQKAAPANGGAAH